MPFSVCFCNLSKTSKLMTHTSLAFRWADIVLGVFSGGVPKHLLSWLTLHPSKSIISASGTLKYLSVGACALEMPATKLE